MDRLNEIARILRYLGDVSIRFKILAFNGRGVAMLNPSGDVVLLACGDRPARNMRRDETAEDAAREILGLAAAKAA